MNFNILVTGGAVDSLASYKAIQFCRQALTDGHVIDQIFFYQQGVEQANALLAPLADEFNGQEQWAAFSANANTPLYVCISAAERRGVISHDQSLDLGATNANLHRSFSVVGLGVFHEATLTAERMVVFK